ncbi:PhzF family phenazine biosynthesis protein [uncultured Friedmanniella sp.]|uniref:PhzF family phenazine biosynthesis protein n=1 Tax=uncultured Friedmanniella sp. TaxID=335381 RepID=UPI0035C9C103
MTRHDFRQLDVFGSRPLSGNPLAVVVDADDLDAGQRQAFARWTGLAETTFLSEPTDRSADYQVHIHTPERELPFAGHPTLGSAVAWLDAGGRPAEEGRVVQQCAAGLVPVRVDGPRLAFAAPPLTRYEPVESELLDRVATGLGLTREDILDASWLVNGPEWLGVRLASAEQVLGVQLVPAGVLGLDIGVVGPHPAGAEVQFEVRAFIPGGAVPEDPVTGSLNAGLAHWLMDTGRAPDSYVAAQGTAIGGAGRVHVERDAEALWIGGDVAPVVSGTVDL